MVGFPVEAGELEVDGAGVKELRQRCECSLVKNLGDLVDLFVAIWIVVAVDCLLFSCAPRVPVSPTDSTIVQDRCLL